MRKRVRFVIPLLFLLAMLATTAATAESPSRKIVVFRDGVDVASQHAAVRAVGGNPLKSIGLVNATVADLAPAAAAALARRADVVRVEDDALAHATAPSAPPAAPPDPAEARGKPGAGTAGQTVPWGITRIKADTAWSTSKGTGVKVAVLDTGISTSHPDLKVAGGVNTITTAKKYNDDNGHGSHVAGIIAALNNSAGVVGVGPEISLYAVKVLGASGSGWISDIIEGLDWSVRNGMQVVNMSLGTSSDLQTFREAVARSYGAGITLVAAAGNSGPGENTVNYPARYPGVIAVSAIDSNGALASWSSRGPEVDLAAPGVSIYSTYKGSGYTTLSGTSMASPHVAGVAALWLKKHGYTGPSVGLPDTVTSVLKGTTEDLGLGATQQGAGLVRADLVVAK